MAKRPTVETKFKTPTQQTLEVTVTFSDTTLNAREQLVQALAAFQRALKLKPMFHPDETTLNVKRLAYTGTGMTLVEEWKIEITGVIR